MEQFISTRIPPLTPERAEQLFTILRDLVQECIATGRLEQVLAPTTILNASRLLLVPEQASAVTYAVIGMVLWLRSNHLPSSTADFHAAFCLFTHAYKRDPRLVPEPLRTTFAERPPGVEPISEVWHSVAVTLVEEFRRDGGGLLLDAAILLIEAARRAAPLDDPSRAVMQYNLGSTLETRFDLTKDLGDLDAGITALRSADMVLSHSLDDCSQLRTRRVLLKNHEGQH